LNLRGSFAAYQTSFIFIKFVSQHLSVGSNHAGITPVQ
jgi:hypothetical protein